ncbi:MAG: S8 family peptidase [Magnetococcales bacterium]|nr:S8 family peptidase [Magnetococcales bacterium]
MPIKNTLRKAAGLATHFTVLTLAVQVQAATTPSPTYAPWLTQIGLTNTIESAANWGKGQLLITVDTGIVTNNAVFAAGQVANSLSSCAAVTFKCTSGYTDDNGHGTAVASIAAANGTLPFAINYGGYKTAAGSVIGVAPNANIAAEKVLNAAGSGYDTDVANGITKAANAGAAVINLSLTYMNDPAIVSAINYAASKGAFIVWAGGNSAAALVANANTTGLTDTAIAHLIFAGSVSSGNGLSSFSNTPGSGSLVNAAGARSSYASRWIMAPGENILAPDITSGAKSFAAWSGTSMSTPIISGSLLLLESAWPILKTNGTTANLLLNTASDLGSKGVDNSYGTGLVNLGTAFQPYGTLTITEANGKSVAMPSLTGAMITGGALGSLSSVQSKLANYTALDGYQRNYSVNLAGLILTKPTAATVNPLPTNTNTGPNKMSLADGGELSYQFASTSVASAFGPTAPGDAQVTKSAGYILLTDRNETTVAFGYGDVMPSHYSYTKALYASDAAALAASTLSTNLTSLAQGGMQLAYGTRLGENTRLALSYSGTAAPQDQVTSGSTPAWMTPSASSLGAGLSLRLTESLQMGVSWRTLDEKNSLMGTAYDTASLLNLGRDNHSNEIGISALISLDRNNTIYLEASQATTQSANGASNSVFAGMSRLRAQSWGISLASQNVFNQNDQFTATLKQPLRVTAGSVNMAMTHIDPVTGVPSTGLQSVSLVPTGREMDYQLSYDTPLSKTQKISLQAGYVQDAQNMAGNNAATIGMNWSVTF